MVMQYSYDTSLINSKMYFLLFSNVFTYLFLFLSFPQILHFYKKKNQINSSKEFRSHILFASAMQALELKTFAFVFWLGSVHP